MRVSQSVSIDGALPSVKHLRVVVLFGLDASLVLQFCQLGRSLLVHNFLQLAAHGAVSFANLAQYVCLVHLFGDASLDHLLFICSILALDFSLHILALVLFHPFLLFLLLLFEFNVLLSVLVNILKQVDAGLILAVPLSLTLLPLFGILFRHKLVNHALIGLLVSLLLRGILLELNRLPTMRHLFLVFNLLDHSFSLYRSLQELQIALLLSELGLFSQTLLLLVVFQESQIPFSIQNLALTFSLFLSFLVQGPLSTEHLTFGSCQLFFLVTIHLACLFLPFQY